MDTAGISAVEILFKILPGLVAAAVFHSVTPFPKRDVFDRIVNALIFTAIGAMIVSLVRLVLSLCGFPREWPEGAVLWVGVVGATCFSLVLAYCLNNDLIHDLLRSIGFTKRVALPSPWYSAHSRYENFVTLTLKDSRRITGWPKEWPDSPDSGHYILTDVAWINEDESLTELSGVLAFILDAADVEHVEFMKDIDLECKYPTAVEKSIENAQKDEALE